MQAEISLINSNTKIKRVFKISIYNYFINNVNIYLNNKSNKFYCSDIIFYGEINKIKLDNFQYDTFNLTKRLRCVILNIEQNKLFEIIRNNNYNNDLNSKAYQVLSNNFNKNLLINIYVGNNESNVLIFHEKEKKLIVASEEEKNLFSEFYHNINNKIGHEEDINEICNSFENLLISRKKLFKSDIGVDESKNISKIIFSFLGQGMNCLLDNGIINENDKYFIFGCLIFLLSFREDEIRLKKIDIIIFNNIIDELKKNNFNSIEQMKAVISYTTFYISISVVYNLEITSKLKDNNPFIKGFNFYKNIIKDLTEESDLMLIFLQLNSGAGKELINDKNCYKISMIPISEIKEHLINNIPKYFFYYYQFGGPEVAVTDTKTQISAFNKEEIFSCIENNNNNDHNDDNKTANVLICMFHEGRHQKFHMDIEMCNENEPVLFISKTYIIISQEILFKKDSNNNVIGESGMCVDYYLYNSFFIPGQIIIRSSQSYKLLNKELFTGKLEGLNKISNEIIEDYLKKKINSNNPSDEYDIDALINAAQILKKEDKSKLDSDYIIIEGEEYFCGLGLNY